MWSSSQKEGFSTAGEELGGYNRDSADAREVERVKESSGELSKLSCFAKLHPSWF